MKRIESPNGTNWRMTSPSHQRDWMLLCKVWREEGGRGEGKEGGRGERWWEGGRREGKEDGREGRKEGMRKEGRGKEERSWEGRDEERVLETLDCELPG